jgi:long-subunit acyl-CoA synthetase (AMP-forming)
MKNLLTLTNIAGAVAALALMAACQTTTTGSSQAVSQREALLAQSGFKVITVTTPKQQQAINGLAQGTVSAVKYNGKLYFVYPTTTKDKIYVGKQKQVNAFKKALAAQQAQSAQPAQPGQQTMNPAPTMAFQGHGQQDVVVDQFDGFGPMGTAQLGDW